MFELGLKSRRYLRLVGIGFIAFLFHRPFLMIFGTIAILTCRMLGIDPVDNPLQDLYNEESLPVVKALLLILPVISAPFFEELFFRGVLYKILRKRLNANLTILFTAVMFAAVHPGLNQFINILVLGLVLAYLVEKTGSIIPAITLHFLVNFTSIIALALGMR